MIGAVREESVNLLFSTKRSFDDFVARRGRSQMNLTHPLCVSPPAQDLIYISLYTFIHFSGLRSVSQLSV